MDELQAELHLISTPPASKPDSFDGLTQDCQSTYANIPLDGIHKSDSLDAQSDKTRRKRLVLSIDKWILMI